MDGGRKAVKRDKEMKNFTLKTLALCLAAACLLAVPASADTIGGGTVSADALNLRSEASLTAPVKLLVPGGAFVLVEEHNDSWSRIVYNGTSGYVSSQYISFAENADGQYGSASVTGTDVRMRSGPSTTDNVIGCFDTDDELSVIGVAGSWLKVATAKGAEGYIRSDLLKYSTDAVESTSQTTGGSTSEAASRSASQTTSGSTSQATGTSASTAASYVSSATSGEQIVATAKEYLGYRYVWGGMSTAGFDCSGFVNYVYKQYGYSMNRVAQSIYSNDGVSVEKENLQPGDLVFFGYSGTSVSHVGMYMGDGQMIHASSSDGKVVTTDISSGYYTRMYVGAKRII